MMSDSEDWEDDLVERAMEGDVEAISQVFDAAPQELVDDVFLRAPGADERLFEVLVAALRTDDPRLRTRARRELEARGWDERAYSELNEENEQ